MTMLVLAAFGFLVAVNLLLILAAILVSLLTHGDDDAKWLKHEVERSLMTEEELRSRFAPDGVPASPLEKP